MIGVVKEWHYDPMLKRVQTRFSYYRQLPHESFEQYLKYLESREKFWALESFDAYIANGCRNFKPFGGPDLS